MNAEVDRLLPARRGHFLFESGHHGDVWLDLERLCLRPEPVRRLAGELATRLAAHQVDAVCGPLVEGAFVALMVAGELGVPFTYSERVARGGGDALYPFTYRIPGALRGELRGARVAIVNDVVNAGSAVRGTWEDLVACQARPVALAALATLGGWAAAFAAERALALEVLAASDNQLWLPDACPLCARGLPLEGAGHG